MIDVVFFVFVQECTNPNNTRNALHLCCWLRFNLFRCPISIPGTGSFDYSSAREPLAAGRSNAESPSQLLRNVTVNLCFWPRLLRHTRPCQTGGGVSRVLRHCPHIHQFASGMSMNNAYNFRSPIIMRLGFPRTFNSLFICLPFFFFFFFFPSLLHLLRRKCKPHSLPPAIATHITHPVVQAQRAAPYQPTKYAPLSAKL